MNNDLKVSVVITAYNVSEFIEKCLKSVFNQTYKNIEVVTVEDCSTDSTLDILNNYKDKIKLVKNEKNVGAGLSRRYGIQNSTGDYVLLLDADDWLNEDFIEQLVKKQNETDADIVSGGISYYYQNDDRYDIKTYGSHVSEEMKKFTDYNDGKIVFLNNKIVRKSLYDKVEYCDRRYVEDTPVIMKLLYYANKVAYVNNAGYNYLQRDSSLCHTASKWKHMLFSALCCAELIEWFKDKPEPYNKLFPVSQFVMYLKNMQREKVTIEEMSTYIVEYNSCFTYLLNLIK